MLRGLYIIVLVHIIELLVARSVVKRVKAFLIRPEERFRFLSLCKLEYFLVFVFAVLIGDCLEADETLFIHRTVSFLDWYFSRLIFPVDCHWLRFRGVESHDRVWLIGLKIFGFDVLFSFPFPLSPNHTDLLMYLLFGVDSLQLHFLTPLLFFLPDIFIFDILLLLLLFALGGLTAPVRNRIGTLRVFLEAGWHMLGVLADVHFGVRFVRD